MADAMAPILPAVGGKDGPKLRREAFSGLFAGPGRTDYRPGAHPLEEADVPEVYQAAARLNDAVKTLEVSARFRVLDEPHQVIVEMYDAQSGEVIREIPPRRFLEMYADMMRMVGLNLDREA